MRRRNFETRQRGTKNDQISSLTLLAYQSLVDLPGKDLVEPTLGRTLAMLDWNRDGKVDFVANHLEADRCYLVVEGGAEAFAR